MESVIKISNLTKSYGKARGVINLNLTVNKGDIFGFMGPNGAGKSTLMNLIMNNPKYILTDGEIIFENENINDKSVDERARLGIFMSFQSPYEVNGVSLENFIRTSSMAVTGNKVSLLKFKKELDKNMENLKIDPSYSQRSVNVGFSGGEKKKAEILQMSMLNPKLAMLDETDSGLDVDAVRIVSNGVKDFHNENNSVIIITHHKEILNEIKPDFVHVLVDGKIVKTGGAELIHKIEEEGYGWLKGE